MKVLYYPVGKNPEILEVDNDLDSLQVLVEGYIEQIPLIKEKKIFLYCNEEGNIRNLPLNRFVNGIGIKGNFFICQTSGDSFSDLEEQNIRDVQNIIN